MVSATGMNSCSSLANTGFNNARKLLTGFIRLILTTTLLLLSMHVLILTDSYPPEVRSAAQLMGDLTGGLVTSVFN